LAINAVSKQDDENATAALKQGEADVAAAAAAVRSAEVILGYARIKAPIDGRIGKSTVTQGALVTANQEAPLATVQQLDPIYVDLTQSSAEWLALRRELAAGRLEGTQDMPVAIVLEDGTPYAQPGKLAFSEVSVDPTTGSFALRVVVPNPENILLPGMYVRAIVGTGTRQSGLLVPQQGIARDPKGHTTAMVVGQDGKVEVRPVRVSQAIGDKWLVEEGLAAGDQVIVEGLQKVQPGALVQPTEAGATPPPAAPPAPAQQS
jgi:membrane fusion protein (multidrug efflux system)